MFGLSKLFSSKSVQKQPIIAALAAYRSAAFAVGIDESFIESISENDDKLLQISLTLPFAHSYIEFDSCLKAYSVT